MKTKFILHGGYVNIDNESNSKFYSELIDSVPENGVILVVFFASIDEERADAKFATVCELIQEHAGGKNVLIKKATKDSFLDEVRTSDAIFIRGGDTQRLKDVLDLYPNFTEAIRGKVVAGSSAGAYVLSNYYFTNSIGEVREGFGCVPIRTICHYQSEIHPMPNGVDPVMEINKFDQDLELVLLRDYEWVVKEIET